MADSLNATCTSTDMKRTICLCGKTCEDDKMKPVLPGMSDTEPQFHPYCEIGLNMKDELNSQCKQKTFKSTVQRHFVKGKLFNLVNDFLESIDEEKQAQQDLFKSFAQVREITVPLLKAKENHNIGLKRRKQQSNVSLLDQIEEKRQNVDSNNERNTNSRVFNTKSETPSELKIDLSVRSKVSPDYSKWNPERQKDKHLHTDATFLKNGKGNPLTKRRRSISSSPGFFEKMSVIKYFMNGNNIREVDKLVLESLDEITESTIDFGQKRMKEKIEQAKCKIDTNKPNKQYDVTVEVEPFSDGERDEDSTTIINGADSQPNFEKSKNLVRDHELDISCLDKETNKVPSKSTNLLQINLSNLKTEVSHEPFNTIKDCKDVSFRGSRRSKTQSEKNNDVSVTSFQQKSDRGHEDKSQIALESSKSQSCLSSSSVSKVYKKKHLIQLRNSKKTKSVSQKVQKRTLTLNILDVYEENADLQKLDKHFLREKNRSNVTTPYIPKKRTTQLKSSKESLILDPCKTEFKGEIELNGSTSFSPYESLVGGNVLNTQTSFQIERNSQRDKLYQKPERVLWYNLDITEGCYKVCNGSSAKQNYHSGSHTRVPAWNVPIRKAIKNTKGTNAISQITQLNESHSTPHSV